MKKITTFLIATIAVFLVACSDSPKNVAKAFSEKLAQGKISEAKEYTTEGTGKFIDGMAPSGAFEPKPDSEFSIVEEKIEGEKATVKLLNKNTDETETIHLVKVDGEWKVTIKK